MKAKLEQNASQDADQEILISIESGEWNAVDPAEHARLLEAFGA